MKFKTFVIVVVAVAVALILSALNNGNKTKILEDKTIKIISSVENSDLEAIIEDYENRNDVNIEIDYENTLDIIDVLNEENDYDAVWISNSLWLYMLNSNVRVSDSKIININPVVFGIRKKKAKELGFTSKDVSLSEIINEISNKNLKFATTNATQTNTGASSYLSFLSILAGNPEVLKEEHLKNIDVVTSLTDLYKNVLRTSGNETYLQELYKKGDIDAVVISESSLINFNKTIKNDNDIMYAIYPSDGVAISDCAFAYLKENNTPKEEAFLDLQKYLLSKNTQKEMMTLGRRTWYGGVNEKAPKDVFNKKYGIDTTKYLLESKYPSKDIIKKALNLYQTELRKPVSLVFALDYSGSMYGTGVEQLTKAMHYVLDNNESENNFLQFTKRDKIGLLTFSDNVSEITSTTGDNTKVLLDIIDKTEPYGTTNIYDSVTKSIKYLENENTNEYNLSVVLMTDGYGNTGNKSLMNKTINNSRIKVPVYGIMFAEASSKQLSPIAKDSGGTIFDGTNDLVKAFKTVRGFN